MTTYNTGNPLGSSDPRDLYDNAENLDSLVNGEQPAYSDRLGKSRKSWAGMESEFAAFIAASGYEFLGDYAAGIEVTGYQQVVRDISGEFWRLSGSTTLPYTTTGAGLPEGGAFVAVGDAVLRQELAASTTGQGSDLIAHAGTSDTVTEALDKRVIYVGSVTDAEALAVADGYSVILTNSGVAGEFVFDDSNLSTEVSSDPLQAIYIAPTSDPTGSSGALVRRYKGLLPVEAFGGLADQGSGFDNAPYIEASLNLLGYAKFQAGTYHSDEVTVPSGTVIVSGEGIDKTTVHFLSASNSNGFNAASANDRILVQDMSIRSTKTPGIFTQAITAVNPDSISIKNVAVDGFSQFSVSIRLQQNKLFNEIIVDNLTVAGAGNTDNGISNCFEIFAGSFDAATKRTIIKNSSFTTDLVTKGNIAKFATSLFGVVENCTFTCASRDGTSSSSGVEIGSSSNSYTYSGSNFRFKSVDISDNATTGLKSLSPKCEEFSATDCDLGSGPFVFDNQASKLKFTQCRFDTILAGGTTTSVGLLEFINCEVSAYDLDDSASLVFDEIRVIGGSVSTRFQNINSTTDKLIIDGVSFPLAVNEHYVVGNSVCHVRNCSVYEGPSSAPAINTFTAYTDAEFSNNEVDTGANRQFVFTVANGATVVVRHNGVKKSDAGAPAFLGVVSGTITGFSNVVNGVLT